MAGRVFTRTEDLVEGLRVEQEVMNNAGLVLIARGTILDRFMIQSIENMDLEGIYTETIGEEEFNDLVEQLDIDYENENISPESVQAAVDDPKEKFPPQPQHISPLVERMIEKISVEDRAKVELSEEVKARAAQSVSNMFNYVDSPDFARNADSVTQDLMRAITENEAVAVDIGALKVCDEYTFKHSVDVAAIAMIIAKMYGLSEEEVYEVGIAGLLHDIGKSRIPRDILYKPSKLTDEEYVIMKRHSYYSYDIIRNKPEFSDKVKVAVLEHHEKLNGSGYPMKLGEHSISLYARIIAIADIYDALASDRPYKKAYAKRDVVEIIMSMTRELDLDIMQTFLRCVILYPVGSDVYLSNGEWARVVENDPNYLLRPKVVGTLSGRVYDLSGDVNCANIIVKN